MLPVEERPIAPRGHNRGRAGRSPEGASGGASGEYRVGGFGAGNPRESPPKLKPRMLHSGEGLRPDARPRMFRHMYFIILPCRSVTNHFTKYLLTIPACSNCSRTMPEQNNVGASEHDGVFQRQYMSTAEITQEGCMPHCAKVLPRLALRRCRSPSRCYATRRHPVGLTDLPRKPRIRSRGCERKLGARSG